MTEIPHRDHCLNQIILFCPVSSHCLVEGTSLLPSLLSLFLLPGLSEQLLFDAAARRDLLLASDQFLLTAAPRSTFALRLLTGRLNQKEFDVTDDVPTHRFSVRRRRGLVLNPQYLVTTIRKRLAYSLFIFARSSS